MEKQGRFADAGVTGQQCHGSGHDSPTHHPVKFTEPAFETVFLNVFDVRKFLRRALAFGLNLEFCFGAFSLWGGLDCFH
jgi:hypothetical protein